MVTPNCLFCNNRVAVTNRLPVLFNKKIFSWLACSNCKLLFLWPALTVPDKELLYNIEYHRKYYFNYTEKYDSQLRTLLDYGKKTVLDFGCGDAGLLAFLYKNNFIVTGVEFNEVLVEKLRENFDGINFIQEKLFWSNTETFDVIHLGDVLEHTSEPFELMQKLSEKLSPGGIFFIEGPMECNPCLAYYFRLLTYALKKRLYKESVRVKLPYHITYTNAYNQQLLFKKLHLNQLEFKVLEAGWPYVDKIKEVNSPWTFLQYLISGTSIFISSFIKGWGNRFVYVGKPVTYSDKTS